jgi:hypothetical protein
VTSICVEAVGRVPLSAESVQRTMTRRLWASRLYILVLTGVGALVLSSWIGFLTVSLRPPPSVSSWRTMWIGFDVMELTAYVTAAWGAWRRHAVVIPALYAAAALLLCDAWFDTTLAWGTSAWTQSLVLAIAVEVPTALLLTILAYRTSSASRAALLAAAGQPTSRASHI